MKLLRNVRVKYVRSTVECCSPKGSLSRDLAQRISELTSGKVAIVAENPIALLPSTKKQWMKLIRRTQRDRAATLNTLLVVKLAGRITRMQSLKFTAKPPDDLLEADVTFATVDDFVRFPPVCSIVYVTYEFKREKLHMLTSWMPRSGKVVIYE